MNFTTAFASEPQVIPVHLGKIVLPEDLSLANILRLTGKEKGRDFKESLLASIPPLKEIPDYIVFSILQAPSFIQEVEYSLTQRSLKPVHPCLLALYNLFHPDFSKKHLNATQWKVEDLPRVLIFNGDSYHLNDKTKPLYPKKTIIGGQKIDRK